MVPDLLTDPDAFFEREAEDPGWLRPTGIVVLAAVVGVLSSVPVLRATMGSLPPEAGALGPVVYVIGAAGGIIATLVFWVLYSLVFHVISAAAFAGEGSFGDTMKLTGWGFIPHVISGLIGAAVNFYVFSTVQFPSNPARMGAFVTSLRSQPLFVVTQVLGIAFLLWSAFLWAFAMRHGRKLTLRQSGITVGVPVAIVLLYRLYTIIGGF